MNRLRFSLNETGRRLQALTDDLQHQVQRAEVANTSKSMFLANMSHEIRTPLNGMIGMIELLDGLDMPDEQRDYFNTLRSSSKTLLNLLNDILDFSRIEANRLAISLESVPILDIIEEVVALMTPLAESKGLRLQHELHSPIPSCIKADPGRLRQVLSNIIGNAIKFTERGSVQVALSTYDNTLEIAIIDTGIGIPEDKIANVFDAFEQVDGTSQRQHGGTGLGLSISQRLTDMMGGTSPLPLAPMSEYLHPANAIRARRDAAKATPGASHRMPSTQDHLEQGLVSSLKNLGADCDIIPNASAIHECS